MGSSRHEGLHLSAGDTVVVALGGNAIARSGDAPGVASQYARASEALAGVVPLVARGLRVALTHGNGPVVGDIVLRGELAAGSVVPTPLYIADADSEGGIGLMLQQVLGNLLRMRGMSTPVATVVTQVVVDAADPAFAHPVKGIGPRLSEADAQRRAAETGLHYGPDGPGWRRLVASPHPLRIVETPAVRALLDSQVVTIAAGGGGVPVVADAAGTLTGVDAVVDKDWASALLAADLGAAALVVAMEAPGVMEGFGTPSARVIPSLTAEEVSVLLASGSLPEGGIAPKLAACAWFAERTGRLALICASDALSAAFEGEGGTLVTR